LTFTISLMAGQLFAVDAVTINRIAGYDSTANGLMASTPIKYYFNYENGTQRIIVIANYFSISSPDGANWQIPAIIPLNPLMMNFSYPQSVYLFDSSGDGQGADTLGCTAYDTRNPAVGLAPGYSGELLYIETRFSDIQIGKTLCVDSATPSNFSWLWGDNDGNYYSPSWGGPYCYEVVDCCVGIRGDVNGDGKGPNALDAQKMINYLFRGQPAPACDLESDVNSDGTPHNILDFNYIINYQFRNGPAPGPCPLN